MLKPSQSEHESEPAGRRSTAGSSNRSLLASALEASDIQLGVVELEPPDHLRLLTCTPAFAELLNLEGPQSAYHGCDLAISNLGKELLGLWQESCLDAWRNHGTTRFQYLDTNTQPARRLGFAVSPMPAVDEAVDSESCKHRCSVRIERPAESFPIPPEAEKELRASHFHHIVDSLPALIWTSCSNGERDYFNSSWISFTGRPAEEDLGLGWTAHIHKDDLDDYLEAFRDALHARHGFKIEYRMAAQDGTFHWMLDEGVPRFRSDGELLGFVATCTDITERRNTELRLTSSEQWHRELIEGTNNLVLQIDPDGRLEFANPICREILGSEPEECVGFPFLHFVHTEDRERTQQQLEIWRMGTPTDVHFENRLVSRTGEIHDLLWTVNAHLQDGSTVSLSCIGQDITERKRSERIHKIQSQVLESMIEGVTLANQGGFVLYTNRALDEMFGFGPGEMIGQHLSELHGTPKDFSLSELTHQLKDHGTYVGDFTHRRKDGSAFHTIARIQSLDIEGAVHWVSVIEDINEKRLAEEDRERLDARVRQAQKLESLGVLAGGIAHDFNNLLMVILGNASLVLQDLDPASSSFKDLEQIETAAVRASDLTKQMLAYSGRGQFLVEPTDLSVMIEEIDHLLDSSIGKNAILNFHLPKDLRKVEGDISQLRQVIMSLVNNASEALDEDGGVILVRTGTGFYEQDDLKDTFLADDLPKGHYAFIEISDNGIGMAEEIQSKIFDPFFTTKFTGRGLGLAAVLGIVRGHRGGIKVQSEPGEGSTFTVLLPCVDEVEQEEDAQQTDADSLTMPGTILLVDDDHSVRHMARRMLERLGLVVLDAEGGEQALEIYGLHAGQISVVILDMTMPKMDGQETFRRLRLIDPSVKVVLSSGYSEQIAAERFDDESLAGFLQKPYRQVELVLCLKSVLGLS